MPKCALSPKVPEKPIVRKQAISESNFRANFERGREREILYNSSQLSGFAVPKNRFNL